MTWDELITLINDAKTRESGLGNDRVTMIIDNERWFASLSEDLISGKLSITPQFESLEDDDGE